MLPGAFVHSNKCENVPEKGSIKTYRPVSSYSRHFDVLVLQ